MSSATIYPHIEKTAGDVARLKSHPRIRVAQIVMDYLAHGWSAEEMCRQHPYLTRGEAHAALAYYYDHQHELDAEIRAESAQVEADQSKAPPSPFITRLRTQGHP
jgi:hypothetical protein